MNKEFKKCPRCNFKTPNNMARCGNCGLNFSKFENATNAEAKSAFRMGEKERILYSRKVPSDINKWQIFFMCLFGGWFGLHYFAIGKKWRGIYQVFGFIFSFIYAYFAGVKNIRSGYVGNLILVLGIIWLSTFIVWLVDSISVLFNRFKYPISLPYSSNSSKSLNTKDKILNDVKSLDNIDDKNQTVKE